MSNADQPYSSNLGAKASTAEAYHRVDTSSGERRVLTALSYDIVGSTELLAHSDPEDYYDLITEFQRAVREAVSSRGGTVNTELGDGGLAVFPVDIDAKDAASAAINAGLEVVRVSSTLKVRKSFPSVSVRVGIATSIATVRGDKQTGDVSSVTSLSLAMATRLQAIAQPGAVVVSQQTRSLARRSHRFSFLGSLSLKGIPEPEDVWRALSRKNAFDRYLAFGRVNAPMVDRMGELREVSELWRNVIGGHGEVVLIEGESGIGKSRILHEIRRLTRTERKKMLFFQCLPSGTRSSLGLLQLAFAGSGGAQRNDLSRADVIEIFGQHGIRNDTTVDVFSFLKGVKDPTTDKLKEASLEAIQAKLLDATGRSAKELTDAGPALVAVEDAHWIDPTSFRLLVQAAQSIADLPMLLVVTTRPPAPNELSSLPNAKKLYLNRLDAADTRTVISGKLRRKRDLETPELLDVVERVSGGIPLLIEEICEWAADSPGEAADRFASPRGQSSAAILEGVLDSRLERLGLAKDVILAASAAGMKFTAPLLREMLPDLGEKAIEEALGSLVDAGLVIRGRLPDSVTFAFRHALIQESLYKTLFRKSRQAFHRRLYIAVRQDRAIASWIDDGALAEHAESAGMPEDAIELLIAAGKDNSARSSMTEARQLLEHALKLVEGLPESEVRNRLKLSVLTALGPVLIATIGPGSAECRKLYDTGMMLARQRPVAEQAMWFPIHWGWWFTGTGAENNRAREILHNLKNVDDPEVQLQIRHCNWAIDFYLGQHNNCLSTVGSGLPYYSAERGQIGRTLFGGHDARVCGLCHRSLSLWFTGKAGRALRTIAEARRLAQETGHVGSIVHACFNEAMLHCYRRDFASLEKTTKELRQLAEANSLSALMSTADIYDGWRIGVGGNIGEGQELIKRGLAVQTELQTPEDSAVYCDLQVELMALAGDFDAGVGLLEAAIRKAEKSEYRYWLPALHHSRALILAKHGSSKDEVDEALMKSLESAAAQNAVALQLSAYETAARISPILASRYHETAELARSGMETDEPLFVNPPQMRLRPPSEAAE